MGEAAFVAANLQKKEIDTNNEAYINSLKKVVKATADAADQASNAARLAAQEILSADESY